MNEMTYRVEILVTVSGFVRTWKVDESKMSLRNAEIRRKEWENEGYEARVKAEDEY